MEEEYLREMKTHVIDVIEELKSTRSSFELKLIVRVVFKSDNDNKIVEIEIFITVLMIKQFC